METSRTIDVASLDAMHRRAIEDVIGVQLQANQRITIGVADSAGHASEAKKQPAQTLKEWMSAYESLSDEQIEEIDRGIKALDRLTQNATEEIRPPAPTLAEWASLYDGLSEQQIELIDRIANTRANLTRDVP